MNSGGPTVPIEKVNILMVDDSPDKLLAHESVLDALGQNIVKVPSGEEALRILLKQDFAVILLDVNMPGLNGFETAALIRQRRTFEQIPIIFITAMSTTDADLFKGYSLGAVDYILTPIVPEVLRTKVGVFVEVAKQKRELARQADALRALNEDLVKRAGALSEANKEMEAFSYSIAHDLRAPLRAMEGLTHALVEDYAAHLDETALEYGRRIRQAAQRMDQMIRELLTYSQLNLADLPVTPVRLDQVMKDMLAQLQHDIRARNASVTTRRLRQNVCGHHAILVQVFANLVSNAIKFVPPDRVPQVHIWAEPRDERIRVWVEDNGIGIAPEHQDRIFRVFERLHTSERYPGTGIGLAIVRKGIQRLGGQVGLQSEDGKGTKFWVELKVLKP